MEMVTRSIDPTDRRRISFLLVPEDGRMERIMQKYLRNLMKIFRDVEQEEMKTFFVN